MQTHNLLSVTNLVKHFPLRSNNFSRRKLYLKALNGVSMDIPTGKTVALVGESGCGKSTFGRCILRLLEPTSGGVQFDGQNLLSLSRNKLKSAREDMQFIFQDPYSSLNPRITVGKIITEGLRIHGIRMSKTLWQETIAELMLKVGLRPEFAGKYPHEFSGGQRQRICIARALALKPRFIVADEPVAALDVSIQAQILNLLVDLQNDFNLTYLFISHDLSVVRHISNIVAVMYLGHIVEIAPSSELFSRPKHPYTEALISAIPTLARSQKTQRIILSGDVPSPIDMPSGCSFHPRCPYRQTRCEREVPASRPLDNTHHVACHFPRNV
jgi:peptide/nickel transport system ATP-binding protein